MSWKAIANPTILIANELLVFTRPFWKIAPHRALYVSLLQNQEGWAPDNLHSSQIPPAVMIRTFAIARLLVLVHGLPIALMSGEETFNNSLSNNDKLN